MTKSISRLALIAITSIAAAGAAQAQTSGSSLVNANTNQALLGVVSGNGTQQSAPTASVNGSGRPAVGVGALSGKQDHYGSAATVSVANSDRLVGVDGPGGRGSSTSVSVNNPRSAPVLAPR